jgi:hypothetical protein
VKEIDLVGIGAELKLPITKIMFLGELRFLMFNLSVSNAYIPQSAVTKIFI